MIETMILFVLLVTRSHGKRADRIIGGYNCSISENPYMISIIHGKSDAFHFIGGGTLLSERWVLTARKKVIFCHIANFYTVLAGADSPSQFGSTNNKYVRSSVVQRCYSGPKKEDITMEIALLLLVRPIRKGERISYVRLGKTSDLQGSTLNNVCHPAIIMGYGLQKYEPENLSEMQYPSLSCTKLPVTVDTTCTHFRLTSKELGCLFGKNVSACHGDAGGPVMCNGIQYGVLSTALRNKIASVQLRKESKCSSNFILDIVVLLFSCILHLLNQY